MNYAQKKLEAKREFIRQTRENAKKLDTMKHGLFLLQAKFAPLDTIGRKTR